MPRVRYSRPVYLTDEELAEVKRLVDNQLSQKEGKNLEEYQELQANLKFDGVKYQFEIK